MGVRVLVGAIVAPLGSWPLEPLQRASERLSGAYTPLTLWQRVYHGGLTGSGPPRVTPGRAQGYGHGGSGPGRNQHRFGPISLARPLGLAAPYQHRAALSSTIVGRASQGL